MSDASYEYPPTYVEHRPLNYSSIVHRNRIVLGRLRHHFFVSRLSLALRIVGQKGHRFTDYHWLGLRKAIVSVSLS
jgi:hypothetical protein